MPNSRDTSPFRTVPLHVMLGALLGGATYLLIIAEPRLTQSSSHEDVGRLFATSSAGPAGAIRGEGAGHPQELADFWRYGGAGAISA